MVAASCVCSAVTMSLHPPTHTAADIVSTLKEFLHDQISGLQISPRLRANDIKHIENSMFLIFEVSEHGLGPVANCK